MYFIPKNDKIPDPYRNDFVPVEGREVEENQYWFRRIKDGDGMVGKPPPEKRKKQSD